jgi:hypothetical protein
MRHDSFSARAQTTIRSFAITLVFAAGGAAAGALALPTSAHARDMQGRLGLGYNAEFANSLLGERTPGISIKYGLTRDIAAEAVVGVTTTSPVNTVTGIKFFKNIFYETNLNFYFMLGGAILSANSRTGAQFIGGFGVEFFIPGLESIGFATETGGSFDNLGGSFALRTLGVSFLDAGIHFYF